MSDNDDNDEDNDDLFPIVMVLDSVGVISVYRAVHH